MSKRQITNDFGIHIKRCRFEDPAMMKKDPPMTTDAHDSRAAQQQNLNEIPGFHLQRLLGRGFTGTTTSLTPPLSFVGEVEQLMNSSDLARRPQSIQSQHSPPSSLSGALTSFYYHLLLDASCKSLDEELVRIRQLHILQRDFHLSPEDVTALCWAAARRLGGPSFLSPFQQDFGAPMISPSRNCLEGSSNRASCLGTTADILSEPPHHTAGSFLAAFKENQASLQAQQLLAKNDCSLRSHSLHPTSSVETLLPSSSLYPGCMGKVQRYGPQMDLPENLLQPQEHKTSDGGKRSNMTHSLLSLPAGPDNKKKCPHFSERGCVTLATDEDPNWLSEFLCFVRSDIVEVFRASEDDVKYRNNTKKVNHGQVGIRCRFCAHVSSNIRTRRSSSFPFTLSRIYQSLTMMLRDHFGQCPCIPDPIKERYLLLKGNTPQGASGSNQFWESSASKLGLIDSPLGIWVKESSDLQGKSSNGNKGDQQVQSNKSQIQTMDSTAPRGLARKPAALLVKPTDQTLVSDFLYDLMTHVQLVHLDESERIGNRKNLPVGMPGLGCRYCCSKNRKGLCLTFPARRRNLSQKLSDLYEHIRRCSLCPKEHRERLIALNKYHEDSRKKREITNSKVGDTDFLDRLWESMEATRTNSPTNSSVS